MTHNTREIGEAKEIIRQQVFICPSSQHDVKEIWAIAEQAFDNCLHQELQKAYKRGVEDEINRESQNMDAVIAGMLQKAREEERERIEAIFKEHVPPHAMDLEDSVWLKRLLNKAFEHENIY